MKTKLFLLLSVLFIGVACTEKTNLLIGKWELVKTSSPQRMKKALNKGLIVEFNKDNTYISSSLEGINAQDGWRIENNTLYMTDNSGVSEFEIIKLTESELTLRMSNDNDWIDLMFQKIY